MYTFPLKSHLLDNKLFLNPYLDFPLKQAVARPLS